MAERRMFAKSIVDSDAFIDMPVTARLLYYDLGMRADDDGFVNSPKKIMRMIGASEDDMRILVARKFIIPFESGIVVIKHWRINNYLRKDRYNETNYVAEKSMLKVKENGSYAVENALVTQSGIPLGIPTVDTGKDRLGKDSKGNKYIRSNESAFDSEFESLWKLYPRKQGKVKAKQAYVKARKNGTTEQEVRQGIEAYVNQIKREKTEQRYIKHGSTYFTQNAWLDDYGTTTEDFISQEQRRAYAQSV